MGKRITSSTPRVGFRVIAPKYSSLDRNRIVAINGLFFHDHYSKWYWEPHFMCYLDWDDYRKMIAE